MNPCQPGAKIHNASKETCLLDQLEVERPEAILVVRGNSAYHTGRFSPQKLIGRQITDYLAGRGLATDRLNQISGFYGYPTTDDVQRVIDLIADQGTDLIIGVGGGMVMDIAKMAAILATQNEKPEVYITGKAELRPRRIRLILIPTTAGTGADVTHFSVVYIEKVKYSLAYTSMGADLAFLLPELTYDLPAAVTATSGFDAIAQAIEAFWSVSATNKTRRYSTQALGLLIPYIEAAVNRPTEKDRKAMLLGSCYAGQAINIARTTWAHAASYWLTANKGIAHGHSVMLTLPYLFPLIDKADDHAMQNTASLTAAQLRKRMAKLYEVLGVRDGQDARRRLHSLMEACGLEHSLERLGVSPSEYGDILDSLNPERMKNMPVNISRESGLQILQEAT